MIDVKYPSPEQKEASIARIKAATARRSESALAFLFRSYREIGLPVILQRSYAVYALSCVIFIPLLLFTLAVLDSRFGEAEQFGELLSLFFAASPFVLLLSDGLYQLQERPLELFELQNTKKYTARHLILLRMPLFSLGAILINFSLAVLWCIHHGFGSLLSLSAVIASSVLLYSLINITMFRRFRLRGYLCSAAVWLGINGLLALASLRLKSYLLTAVPATVHLAAAAGMIFLFTVRIRKEYQSPLCIVTP